MSLDAKEPEARVTSAIRHLGVPAGPDIQEALLFLPQTEKGRDPTHLGQLQSSR
jgi:hypothetical protein